MNGRLGTWKGECALWHYVCHDCGCRWNTTAVGARHQLHAPSCPQCGSGRTKTISCKQAEDACPVESRTIPARRSA